VAYGTRVKSSFSWDQTNLACARTPSTPNKLTSVSPHPSPPTLLRYFLHFCCFWCRSCFDAIALAWRSLDEPEAKAAMIWIIGEYSDRIERPDQIFESYFVENFHDETPQVRGGKL